MLYPALRLQTASSLLLALFLWASSGCSTSRNRDVATTVRGPSAVEQMYLDASDRNTKLQVENKKLLEECQKLTQKCEALKRQHEELQGALQTATNWLHVNDLLMAHKEDVVKSFKNEYEPRKEALFAAMGGRGNLKEFDVDDVCFFGGYVIVSTAFFWVNPNGSGGVGRGSIALDPDKQFEISDCSLNGQVALSAQEIASLLNGTPAQFEQKAAEVERSPEPSEQGFKMSSETKNLLLQGGIAVVSQVMLKLLSK